MGAKTGIEWTDATWNPIIGCSRVSEGCRNCYAEGIAGRFGKGKETVYSGLTQIVNGRAVWTGKIAETKQLLQPLSWRKPKRVFVNSMSDLFHENVSDELRDRIFAVMALCPQHIFQVLTKRPERMLEYLRVEDRATYLYDEIIDMADWNHSPKETVAAVERALEKTGEKQNCGPGWLSEKDSFIFMPKIAVWPLPNVWLGVSVENQAAADERIPLLLQTPAAVRFISAEPLLGPVELWRACGAVDAVNAAPDLRTALGIISPLAGKKLEWVICGGESGQHARPMDPDWARSLRDQCTTSGVPFFFKQWGEWGPAGNVDGRPVMARCGKKAAGAMLDGREWKEFPKVGIA